jgi:hypothetical protein
MDLADGKDEMLLSIALGDAVYHGNRREGRWQWAQRRISMPLAESEDRKGRAYTRVSQRTGPRTADPDRVASSRVPLFNQAAGAMMQ